MIIKNIFVFGCALMLVGINAADQDQESLEVPKLKPIQNVTVSVNEN
jgi:hypothetical protein